MRVLVLGGGYAGIVAVTRLERRLPEAVELVLIDPNEFHLVRHELHRVIRRPEFAETISIPFDAILDRAEFRQGRVTDIDPGAGSVSLADGTDLSYDAAVVSFGAAQAFYGFDDVREQAITLDSTADARAISAAHEEIVAAGSGHVVIGGGGLAGVQAAGELAEASRDANADISITLVEQEADVAPRFEPAFQERVHESLLDLDIDVRTGTRVTGATAESVELDSGTTLPADLFVWTGGIHGRAAFDGTRPQIRADLRLEGATFGAGDAFSIVDVDGRRVTPSAQTAIRIGRVAATNVERTVESLRRGDSFRPRLERYRQGSFAWVVSVGDEAVATVGPQVLSGSPAKALKTTVGLGYLSSAGAIREAVEVVRSEFGFAVPRAES